MRLGVKVSSSTARDRLDSKTDASDRPQQSTDLDAQAHAVRLDGRLPARQLLDSLLDSYLTGSTGKALTAPRQRPRQRLDGEPRAQLDRLGDSPGPWAWGQGSCVMNASPLVKRSERGSVGITSLFRCPHPFKLQIRSEMLEDSLII